MRKTLTNREINIIKSIIRSNSGVFGSKLAQICNVTDRSVRNDIKNINSILSKFDYKIHSSKQSGYFIQDSQKFMIESLINQEEFIIHEPLNSSTFIPNTIAERYIFLSILLIYSNNYVTMDHLSNITFASKSSIRNSIKSLQEEVGKIKNLELEISTINGIILIGNESSKRIFLSMFLSKYYENNLAYIKKILELYIPAINTFHNIYEIYINSFDTNKIIFPDKSIVLFSIETLIFVNRTSSGFKLEADYNVERKNKFDLPFELIEKLLNVELLENDRLFLYDTLSYKKVIFRDQSYDINSSNIIEEFYKIIQEKYDVDLNLTNVSKESFAQHIFTLTQRINHNIANDQQFIKEIKEIYPFSFELATNIIPIIQNYYSVKIDESELTFISIHLSVILNSIVKKINAVIVCSNDISESKLLEYKILNKFSEKISLVGNYPIYQLEKILSEKHDIDLIITTSHYSSPNDNISVLQVSPLLNQADIYAINYFITRFYFSSSPAKERKFPSFDRRFFKVYESGDHFQILNNMVNQLYELKFINNKRKFLESVLKREQIFPTIYGNIWLPHPLETVVNKTFFSISIIRTSKKINLIILFCINKSDARKYKYIFNQIAILLSDKDQLKKVIESNTFEEFFYTFHTNI